MATPVTVHKQITVANGGTTSEIIDLSQHLLAGIITDGDFDGTTLTFTGAPSPTGTFVALYNASGSTLSVTTAASRHVCLEPQTFAGARYIKVVTGTSQVNDTTITLVLLEAAG